MEREPQGKTLRAAVECLQIVGMQGIAYAASSAELLESLIDNSKAPCTYLTYLQFPIQYGGLSI